MVDISAAAVKSLREKTGLPMMDCKRALQETGGDQDKAVDWLRSQGIKTKETRIGRETPAGRIAAYVDFRTPVAAMVELKCESAPVAGSADFIRFANDLARQLAIGPGANSAEQLLAQPSLTDSGQTLNDEKDDLFNRMREVFHVGRVLRVDAPCGAYVHHDGSSGVIVEVKGGTPEAAKDVAMHVVAMKPAVIKKEDLDAKLVQKEREILTEAARKEGKPENIIGKMIEGRLKNFFAEQVLLEQPFVKDDKLSVGTFAAESKMEIIRYHSWRVGKE